MPKLVQPIKTETPPLSTEWSDLPAIPGTPQALAEDNIHLWRIPLQQPPEVLEAYSTLLSPDESARARKFRFPHLRDRYIIAHAALRQTLATYLDQSPQALAFDHTAQGKPSLQPAINPDQITFNFTHSKDLALLAITRTSHLGVDLEHRQPKRDLAAIATRNFSPTEASALLSLPEDQCIQAFYTCWTLKEAYLKATGEGLSTPLDSFDVTFPPIAPASLARIASSPDEHLRWQAFSFTLDNHAAALIVEGRNHAIYRAEWSPQTGQKP